VITATRPAWTSAGDQLGYEPVIEDRKAPHQIVLQFTHGDGIEVSCNCLRNGRKRGQPREGPIMVMTGEELIRRGARPVRAMVTAYHRWHANRGIVTAVLP
jgi:hypothetical protein